MGVPLPPNGGGAPPPSPVLPCPSSPLPSHTLCLVLGGSLRRSWGFPPISWFRPHMKGMRAYSGGGSPSPLGWGPAPLSPPPPSLHAVRWGCMLLRGSPLVVGLVLPARPCMLCAGSARCTGDAPSSSSSSWLREIPSSRSGMPCAGSARFLTGVLPLSRLSPRAVGARSPSLATSSAWIGGFPPSWSGMPCAGSACCCTGPSPLALTLPVRRGHARSIPPPLLPTRGLRARLGQGASVLNLVPVCQGGRRVFCSGALPHAPAACLWRALLGGVYPPPPPPLQSLALGAGCCWGGPSSLSVLRWSSTLLARAGDHLLVLVAPLSGGSPAGPLGGSPPLPRCAPGAGAARGGSFPLSLPPLFGRSR